MINLDNNNLDTYQKPTIFHRACKGAFIGGVFGAAFLGASVGVAIPLGVKEIMNRTLGNDPEWMILPSDCDLKQFSGTPLCIDPPFSSYSGFTAYTITVLAACGMALGAIYGVAEKIFSKREQE